MLKETPGSLRAYFGLIALMSFMPLLSQLSQPKIDWISAAIGSAFGCLYFYTAVRMDHLLSRRPNFLRGVLILNLILSGLAAAIGILLGNGLTGLPVLLLAFAVTAYLYSTVGRLAREALAKPTLKPQQ